MGSPLWDRLYLWACSGCHERPADFLYIADGGLESEGSGAGRSGTVTIRFFETYRTRHWNGASTLLRSTATTGDHIFRRQRIGT